MEKFGPVRLIPDNLSGKLISLPNFDWTVRQTAFSPGSPPPPNITVSILTPPLTFTDPTLLLRAKKSNLNVGSE